MSLIRKIIATTLAGFVTAVSAGAASASCVQGDAQGTWQVYSINSNGYWVMCKLSVNSSGSIANTSCTAPNGSSASFSSGKIKLQSGGNCAFNGSFSLGGLSHTIRQMSLSKDKTIALGVGTYSSGSFNFSMTKI